jgi:amino acid adenylation domain-containing protein/thioester reductase-like protein
MAVIDITKDLSALFSQQAPATPNALALEDVDSAYTYTQLDAKVSALANRLRIHGVSRDSLVGVLMGRSADYVIACLAALRAGGAFLVLELAYPPGLLADVIADAKPLVIFTHSSYAGNIKADIPLILLDKDNDAIQEAEDITNGKNLPPLPADDDLERLAFVSYSSGTTGRPKGIANPHRAPVRSYNLRFELSDLHPGDRVACNVFFVWEILRPLLRGATVFAVPDEASYDPTALIDLLVSKKITETLMTPTLLAAVLSRYSHNGARLPDLRTLWLNGEVVTTDLARRAIKALPNTRLLNCYSASETHEIACGDIKEMLDDDLPYCPVGPPMEPEYTYILDDNGQKVELGISGELFVGGSLLAREYINLPETTAKAFVSDPFASTAGARMYRTGDLARMLPSGLLEITGRVGAMIKIRGYSIVPGKVENAIVEELAVRHCAVVSHGDGLDRQLIAYIVRDTEQNGRTVPTIDQSGYSPTARRALSTSLAQYMIPALWIELDELPTHEVSGKADLKRLPPPKSSKANGVSRGNAKPDINGKSVVVPSVDLVAEMWATALNVAPNVVTKEHDFFDMGMFTHHDRAQANSSAGGHSLTLANLATQMARTFGHPIPLAQLAANPTLEGHLQVIQSARDGHTAAIQADLPAILQADASLDSDIQPTNTEILALQAAKTVFLTGATGFLGGFLLKDLIDHTSAQIICLVRFSDPSGDDDSAGMARIRKNLLEMGVWSDTLSDRIEILPGNLSRKHLGLSPDIFDSLAARTQVIIHAGATVNLVYPYALLRGANVDGTREVLRLASQSGATLHYVSTNGVLPPSQKGWPEDTQLSVDQVPEKLADGYGQTKWAAEELVREAASRGMPVKIYRAGTISGHSTTGSTNTYDLLTALIVESLHLGFAPDVDGWRAEMTPVDHVSKAILTIADLGDGSKSQTIFHLGEPEPVRTSDLFAYLNELGYPTKPLGFDKWVQLWDERRGSVKNAFTADILRGGMPTVDFLNDITVLNDAKTKPYLTSITRPAIDKILLATYTRHWYSRGWLPRPPLRGVSVAIDSIKGPLSGRVAVVTGASSGIGAAISEALARSGASVSLAARRVDSLKVLQEKIIAAGGKAIVHPTDVSSLSQVEDLVKFTTESLGPIDILVVCAGVMYFTLMSNANMSQWDQTVDVNCKGLLHCLGTTVPKMLERGCGHVVAISSDAGRKVFPGLGVYSASKFFVEATLQSLRLETAGKGLRVTSLQPGNVATDLLGMSTDKEALEKYGQPSGAKVLDAEDIARAVVYAVTQPEHVAVNEVLIEPRDEPI